MANAAKLLIEAEFAFRNISPGSTNERKYTARAKRYASRLVRKYPMSTEADQARTILRHLGIGYATAARALRPTRPLSPSPHKDHTPEAPHLHTAVQKKVIAEVLAPPRKRQAQTEDDDSWQNIWRIFSDTSYAKKKIMAFILVFAIAIIGFSPFLLVFFLYYAAQPAKIRNHVHQVVTYFA